MLKKKKQSIKENRNNKTIRFPVNFLKKKKKENWNEYQSSGALVGRDEVNIGVVVFEAIDGGLIGVIIIIIAAQIVIHNSDQRIKIKWVFS